MDFIQGLNGLQVTSCIVRHDFANVCPEYTSKRPEKHANKKAKTNSDGPEYVFYNPFHNDVNAANRYLAVSPRASELFDLLKAESADLKARGLSLLWFVLTRCDNEVSKQYIADHVLTRLCEQIPDLLHLNEDALHYLWTIFLDSIRIGSVEKVRVFLSACSLFKHFSKGNVPKNNASPVFSVSRFYKDMVTHEVIDDVGLCDYISLSAAGGGGSNSGSRGSGRAGSKRDRVGSKKDADGSNAAAAAVDDDCDMVVLMNNADLLHSNCKKQLCIILLLGLKGFNILEKPNVVRLIFEHIKHDSLIDSICTIRLFTLIMSQVLSTQCARLSLTLSNTQWSDVPETVITSTAVALSHMVSQITEEQALEPQQLIRLNRILVATCTEFIENVETICDIATLCNVLLKFDVTHLSMADIILTVLRSKTQVAPLYMAGLKCSYSGNMEYMTLVKFMSKWFMHVSNLSRPLEDCLSYVPPLLSQAFFNYGLLSSDQWVRHGTLRLLNCLLRFVTKLQDLGSAESGSVSTVHAVTEHVRSIMPDFKTLINVKRYTKKDTPDDPGISLNIKNKKRSMVSDALGAVLTSDDGDVILEIKKSDLMLTDWLVALSLYTRFVGVGDGKSLYDPCKLLKDEIIEANITEMTDALRESDGQLLRQKTLNNGVELDMALVDCLFRLGIGELHSGLVLTKVQRLCFHHILRRYMDLKCANRSITMVGELVGDYLTRCEGYVRHVLECSGIFSSPVDPWIAALEKECDYQMFIFLFDHCMENPLEVVLGCLSNRSGNTTYQSFKCLNCFVYGAFAGPLFLRLCLGFLLHLCSDSLADFECEGCHVRELNMMAIFKERVKDADISESVGYILKACSGLDSSPYKIHVDCVLEAISSKYAPVKPDTIGALEVVDTTTTTTTQLTVEIAEPIQIKVEDRYLAGCLAIVELVESFDQDANSLKNFIRILIDILALRSLSSDNMEKTLKGKWEDDSYTDLISKFMALDTLTVYTHLFSSLVTLLDTVGGISLDKTVFDGISFDDDVLWAQHYYLSHRLCQNSNISNAAEVAPRLVDSLRKLCDNKDMLTSSKISTAALSFSKLCSLMPQHSMADHAPNLVKGVLQRVIIPLSCEMCQDVLTCEYGVTKYLLDIAACLVTTSFPSPPDLAAVVEILQSQIVIDLTKELCAMNSKRYFVGDAIETNLFLSHITLLRSLVNHLAMARSSIVGLNHVSLYQLIEAISTCYRCSYSVCDIAVKDVIMGIVKIASGMVMDPKSAILRLPQFKDFACVSKILDGRNNSDSGCTCTCTRECHHGVQSHGKLRGWVTMVSGVPMVAEESNWLCLNSKRVSMTLACFPANGYGDYISLRDTFRNLSILYPPHVNRAPKKSDEVFGSVIRLNKILNSHNKYLQHFVVGHPYPYDVDYLIPFFTGRLCMMLYHQLSIYKRDFEAIIQAFSFDGTDKVEEYRQTHFTKMFSLSEAREAARRLHNQINEIQFDQDIGDAFSVPFVEQVIRNGVFEICSLGLLSKSMRKYSMKALGIIMKILQNMLDAAMVRSITPGNHGPFKLRRVGLFGIYQIHSVLCWLQRCQLYASEGDASLHILFASMIVRKVTNPDDPLYKLGNKYLLTRFQPRFQEVPLFFDCFSVHDSSERDSFLSFMFQFLSSSAHLSHDHSVFFERRIFQQLMSFALLETTSYEHKIQICDFVQRCASAAGADTADELVSLGTLTWISTMSSLVSGTVFNDAKDVVLSTLLVSTLTRLLRDLGTLVCGRMSTVAVADDVPTHGSPSNDPSMVDATDKVPNKANDGQGDVRSTIKDVISSLEAAQNVAAAWYHLLRHIPQGMLTTVRVEGYGMYLLTIERVLSAFRDVFEKKPGYADGTVGKLFSTALHMTTSAVVRASALLSKEKRR